MTDLEHEIGERLRATRLPPAPEHLARAVGELIATPRPRERRRGGWYGLLLAAGVVAGAGVLVVSLGVYSPTPSSLTTRPGATGSPQLTAPATSAARHLDTDASDLALSGLDAPTATKYVEAAANDTWVITTLGSDRAAPVEVVSFDDGKAGVAVFIYDYSISKALRVGFGSTGLSIVERSTTSEQPSFSPREIARARELVATSDKVAEKAAGRYEIQSVTGAHAGAFDGHRVLALILSLNSAPGRVLVAYADLTADTVVQVDSPTN